MANLLTPETFEFFARYLLAGYVVIFVRSAFVVGLRPRPTELLIEAVILSLLVQLFAVGLEAGHDVLRSNLSESVVPAWFQTPPDLLKLAIRVLVIPAMLGALLGIFLQSTWRSGILRRLSLPVVHPVRRAHDFAFGMDRAPGLVEITFEDGTKVAGWFGESSLASTDDQRSDLYLERAYLIDEKGDWQELSPPRAILVSLSRVRTIEFLLEQEMENG